MKPSKRIPILIIAVFSCLIGYAQSFEGKIVYKNTYKSKIPNVTDDQFVGMMGDTQEYRIKGNNYKSVLNGTMMQWQMYRGVDNRVYFKTSNAPAIFWRDAAENPDEVQKAEINKGVETIIGKLCDELVLTCKSGIQRYYYDPGIKVDPALFEKHKFGNFGEVVSRTKSLPLKIIVETPQFNIESTATEISAEKIDDKYFEIPEGSQLQKSPF